jgi:hypothetical protein
MDAKDQSNRRQNLSLLSYTEIHWLMKMPAATKFVGSTRY